MTYACVTHTSACGFGDVDSATWNDWSTLKLGHIPFKEGAVRNIYYTVWPTVQSVQLWHS